MPGVEMPQQRIYVYRYVALQLCSFFWPDGGGSSQCSDALSELEPLPLTDDLTTGNFAGTWRPAAIGWLLTKALSSAVVVY